MKKEYFHHITNPLVIIALFIGLVEVVVGFSISAVPEYLKIYTILFVIIYPVLIAIGFFIILLVSPQNFYGPKDYRNDQSFLAAIPGQGKGNEKSNPINELTKEEPTALNDQKTLSTQEICSASETDNDWSDSLFRHDYEKVISLLPEEIVKAKNESEKVFFKSIYGYSRMYLDFVEGESYLQELIREYPREANPVYWLSSYYLLQGMMDKCLNTLDNRNNHVSINKDLLVNQKVDCLKKQEKIDDAIDLLTQSIDNNPLVPTYYLKLIEILSEKDKGKVDSWYRKGLHKNPNSEELLFSYAKYLYDEGRNEEALFRYKTLIELSPSNQDYYGYLGNVYLNLDLQNKALEAYEKANDLSNRNASWIIGNIGNLYNNVGLYSKAIEFLNEAIKLDENSEYAYNRLSMALSNKKQEDKKLVDLLTKGQKGSIQQTQSQSEPELL